MPDQIIVDLPVREAYDRWAPYYDGYDNPMVFAAQRILDRQHGTVEGLDIVEFGCGTGRNLAHFAARGAAGLTGLDLSEGMLAQAADRVPGANLIASDMARPVPLPDAMADLAVFCLVLEHIAEPVTPLIEARRLVRRGGRIVVIEIHPFLSGDGVAAHFRDGGEEVHMPTYPHQFADHLNAFANAGLAVEACREWRPRDLLQDGDAGPFPDKLTKRGMDRHLAVEFVLTAKPTG
ncbi:class I SAM-dependent methyltransferase [Pacificispira sp.]|uniref:class I SAM-dependent methyltransferase n=1 Tax=Pacificispira sp. TaxID=2888761 RepID=UPI003BAC1ACB